MPINIAEEFDVLAHFTPTQDQRKAFAKSGEAMPDGSFYIRNRTDLHNAIQAVGRATPNASESETARRNAVRRHIMKRARALNLTNMIPGTWNSDGTLKQSAINGSRSDLVIYDEVEAFLAHYGVLGMKWGIHRFGDETSGPSKRAVKKAAKTTASIKSADEQLAAMRNQLSVLKANQKIMEGHVRRLGGEGKRLGHPEMNEALALHSQITRDIHSQEYEIVRMQKHRDKLSKSLSQEDLVEEFLVHYGVRGMHWGIRRGDNARGASVSPEAARARELQTQVRKSGTQGLSNRDLQLLVTRLNLEKQYSNLNQHQVGAGRKFVESIGKDLARQGTETFIRKYGPKGVRWVAKKTGMAVTSLAVRAALMAL